MFFQKARFCGSLRRLAPALNKSAFVVASATLLGLASPSLATDGDLDASVPPTYTGFDSDGIATTSFSATGAGANAVAIQSDGKIIAAGGMYTGSPTNFALARYNTDGSLDTSFDSDGMVTTDFNSQTDVINAIAIQSDGKIVVGGFSTNSANTERYMALARYNTNGSLDTSFGTSGKVSLSPAPPQSGVPVHSQINGLALQSDGKIVIVGHAYRTDSAAGSHHLDSVVLRLTSSGIEDTNFNDSFGGENNKADDTMTAVTLQSDGKIVVTGATRPDTVIVSPTLWFTNRNCFVQRFDTSGTSEFYTTIDFFSDAYGGFNDESFALAIQPNGKIIMAGEAADGSQDTGRSYGTGSAFAVARLNADGSFDSSFDGDGKVTTFVGAYDHGYGRAVVLQADGKIVVGGLSNGTSSTEFALARYLNDGSLDSSFGTSGEVITSSNTAVGGGQINALALQSDGKIVAAGQGGANLVVARYKSSLSSNPVNLGITPVSGTNNIGETQIFTSTYLDADGTSNISSANFKITLPGSPAKIFNCLYDKALNKLYVRNDADNAWLGGNAPGSSGVTITNSQGTLNVAGSSVSTSGNMLTVNWSVSLKSPMVGTSTTSLYVTDAQSHTDGWDDQGTWTVRPEYDPDTVSISPSAGSTAANAATTITSVYSDANGGGTIKNAYLNINETTGLIRGVYVLYDQVNNLLYLRNETDTSWLGGYAPGSSNTISNALGSLNCANTTVSVSGNNLTVNWNITLTGNMAGSNNLYMFVTDKTNRTSGAWDTMGTWTITGNVAPVNDSVSPNAGSSTYNVAHDITSVQSDANGADNIYISYLHVGSSTGASNVLRCYYDSRLNKLFMLADNGTTVLGGYVPGSANVISNGQGSLDCSRTTVARSGNNLTIVWGVNVNSGWAGTTKNIYLQCRDRGELSDGYDNMGTWTITP